MARIIELKEGHQLVFFDERFRDVKPVGFFVAVVGNREKVLANLLGFFVLDLHEEVAIGFGLGWEKRGSIIYYFGYEPTKARSEKILAALKDLSATASQLRKKLP